MGKKKRWKPKRLAAKLTEIRTSRGLSQSQMVGALGLKNKINRENISTFERGLREPPLPILLKYARPGVSTDVLINDKVELSATSKELPSDSRPAPSGARMS
jgi:transcriptional regulator with XRE-family HTH domain